MEARYAENLPALSRDECESLTGKSVCIIGCGGLGGWTAELLARTGIGRLTIVDPDIFQESNLNRQLYATEGTLGRHKAKAAAERITAVNSSVTVCAIPEFFGRENAAQLLSGHDAAVDALDNVPSRILLAEYCRRLSIPLVHGAVEGWYGQVSTILPQDHTMDLLYQDGRGETGGSGGGSLAAAAAATAAVQCGEVLKLLTGKGALLSRRLLILDLLEDQSTIVDLY